MGAKNDNNELAHNREKSLIASDLSRGLPHAQKDLLEKVFWSAFGNSSSTIIKSSVKLFILI